MIPEPARRPATGYGLRADELGQQMLMGGVAAAAIALIIVLLIVAGFVIAGVLSVVAALVIVALLRLFEWESAPGHLEAYKASVFGDQECPRRSPNVEVLGSLIALALFSVIGGIFSMAARLRGPFLGPTGYVRSCVTGQVAWPAGFFGIFGMFVALVYVMR